LIIVEVTKCGWLSEYITLYLLLPIGAIEGLLVGLDEAEPLDMRYQAEPRNEGNRGFVGGLGRGGASGYALRGRAWERGIGAIEGLLVGWGEAEPLDMRYQAEPGNEGMDGLNYHTIAIMVSI
jgi:hypothetical protein